MTDEVIPLDDVSGIVKPALTVEQTRELAERIRQVKAAIISDSDTVSISGKQYITRSGVRKYAMAFNVSDEVLSKEREVWEDEHGRKQFAWTVVVRAFATDPKGRVVKECQGIGVCATTERRFAHPHHDVLATAHTRAKNRAIMDLIGGGEVTAEEIVVVDGEASPSPKPASTTDEKGDPALVRFERDAEMTKKLKEGEWAIEEWEDGAYIVHRNGGEAHTVRLEVRDNATWVSCTCPDFRFRRRACVHCHAAKAYVEGLLPMGVNEK
ncbi:MAG: hypothetical protein ACXQT3_02940 [Methermicoccaceae archaeon]